MSPLSVAVMLAAAMLFTAPDRAGASGGGMTLQSVPILPEPAQLAGDWVISAAEASVAVTLSVRPAAGSAGAPAWALEVRSGALEALELGAATAWRAAPDGIAFVAADGPTVAFFSAEGSDRYVHLSRRGPVVLAREAG